MGITAEQVLLLLTVLCAGCFIKLNKIQTYYYRSLFINIKLWYLLVNQNTDILITNPDRLTEAL